MIKKEPIWLIASILTIVASVIIIVAVRPVWGIDFIGGTLMEFSVNQPDLETIRNMVEGEIGASVTVQQVEGNTVLLKSAPLFEAQHQQLVSKLREENILSEELRFESIGPTIGAELRRKALIAISVVVAVLIAYLAYAFRQASDFIAPWKFGVAAVYALIHDLLVVMAMFVILGKVLSVPIDTLFVTAMLAILGYSVNDTIVIFNRLKYEWVANRSGELIEVLDLAVSRSLIRSLNTSATTLLVLGALILLGGSTIRWFVVALAAGTIIGTYSSIFVASPLLYYLAKR